MRAIFLLVAAVLLGLVVYQRRELQAARLRGDMYRDIAARLDRQVLTLGGSEH